MSAALRLVSGFRAITTVALCGAALHIGGATASAQGFGTIKGRLVFGGDSVPEPKLLVKKGDSNAKDSAVCAAGDIPSRALVVDPKTKGVQFGAAYVVAPKGKNPEAEAALLKKSEVEIDQKGCEFVPHVIALHNAQTLSFKSSDPVPHNVHYTAFSNGDLNQMLAPQGSLSKKFASAKRRPCKLVCDIHPWMDAYFLVFDHPFFAITGPDGSFEIKGVPAGAQNVVVWQESVGYVTPGLSRGVAVEVKAGETVDLGEVKLVPKGK